MHEAHAQLKTLRICKTRVRIVQCAGLYKIKRRVKATVKIVDSQFDDSCIIFANTYKIVPIIVIRNTTFHNCSCKSVIGVLLNVRYNVQPNPQRKPSLILHDVNISDNRSPYTIQAHSVKLNISGHSNLFHRNLGAVYIKNTKLSLFYTVHRRRIYQQHCAQHLWCTNVRYQFRS